MSEDNVKRNKRITEWQRDKRITILVKDRDKIKQAAEAAGQSVNAWIGEAINERLKRDSK